MGATKIRTLEPADEAIVNLCKNEVCFGNQMPAILTNCYLAPVRWLRDFQLDNANEKADIQSSSKYSGHRGGHSWKWGGYKHPPKQWWWICWHGGNRGTRVPSDRSLEGWLELLLCRISSRRLRLEQDLNLMLETVWLHHLWTLRRKLLAQLLGDGNRDEWWGLYVIWIRQPDFPRNLIRASSSSDIFNCKLVNVSTEWPYPRSMRVTKSSAVSRTWLRNID